MPTSSMAKKPCIPPSTSVTPISRTSWIAFLPPTSRNTVSVVSTARSSRSGSVRLGSRNVFLPDLAFVPADRLAELPDTHIPFAPALVVEVLSPRTADRDVGPKFAAYEEHGVEEYWVLDPETLDHRFYRREEGILTAFGENEEIIPSPRVTGFHLRRSWLDPGKLPAVADCLASIDAGG